MIGLLLLLMQAAQPPAAPRFYVYYALPGSAAWIYKSVFLDPPLMFSVDAAGQAHLSAYVVPGPQGPAGPKGSDATYAFGEGFLPISVPPYPMQVGLDTSFVAYRTSAPAGQGPCGPSVAIPGGVSQTTGTGAWGADKRGLFVCVQTAPGAAGSDPVWAWMNIPGVFAF